MVMGQGLSTLCPSQSADLEKAAQPWTSVDKQARTLFLLNLLLCPWFGEVLCSHKLDGIGHELCSLPCCEAAEQDVVL